MGPDSWIDIAPNQRMATIRRACLPLFEHTLGVASYVFDFADSYTGLDSVPCVQLCFRAWMQKHYPSIELLNDGY